MNIVAKLLELARGRDYTALYGTHYQINDFMNDSDFSKSKNGTVVYMYLITGLSMVNGRYRTEVGIFFARLCDFDFNTEATLEITEELKEEAAALLKCVNEGNEIRTVGNVRYQFGYDDFAENVVWCCARVTVEECAAVCVPFGERCFPVIHEPVVETLPAELVGKDRAVLNGRVVNPDAVTIEGEGFYIKKITEGEWRKITVASVYEMFNTIVLGLDSGTEYEYKAYIVVGDVEKYGDILTFRTEELGVISVETLPATDITRTGFTVNALIVDKGEAQILTRCAKVVMSGYDASNAELDRPHYYRCFAHEDCSEQTTDEYSVTDGIKFAGETYSVTPCITAVIDGEEKEIKGDAVEVTTLPTTHNPALVVETLDPEIGAVVTLKGKRTLPYSYTIQNGFFLKKKGGGDFIVLSKAGTQIANFSHETELENGEYIVQAWSIFGTTPYYITRGEFIEFTV